MARSLSVVVHKSGGAWSDLAVIGEGLGYETTDEAVSALAKPLTDSKAWRHHSMKSLGRIGELTFDKFTEKLRDELRVIGL